jgi:hypothetical protein
MKRQYDKNKSPNVRVHVGNRVWVYNQKAAQGPAYKLARPYLGPYLVLAVYDNNTCSVRRVDERPDKPGSETFTVNLEKVRLTADEIAFDKVWNGQQVVYVDEQYQLERVDTGENTPRTRYNFRPRLALNNPARDESDS